MLHSLRTAIAVSLFLAIPIAIGYQVVVADSEYIPVFGKGQHTVWDEDSDDYDNTYWYTAQPTDYGWYTSVSASGDYSTLVFVCYYEEEEDSPIMAARLLLRNHLPFAVEEVPLTATVGEYETVEIPSYRREDEHYIVEFRVTGFQRSRASETVDIGIGPFMFEHNIKGLFDVPVARNLLWCNDHAVERRD